MFIRFMYFAVLFPTALFLSMFPLQADDAATADIQHTNKQSIKVEPLQPEWQQIQSSLAKHDLAAIDDIMGKLQAHREIQIQLQKWDAQDEQRYLVLVARLCDRLTGSRIPNAREDLLAQKFALSALESSESISPAAETFFARYTWRQSQHDLDNYLSGQLKVEDWVRLRGNYAQTWLRPLARLDEAIDSDFDVEDPANRPLLNVPVPKGSKVGIVSGVSPKHIKDPQLRAQYQAAINANAEKAKKLWEQTFLRSLAKEYSVSLQKLLVKVYSTSPYNIEELEHYLDKYLTDKELKTRILRGVEEAIQRNAQEEKDKAPQTPLENAENK